MNGKSTFRIHMTVEPAVVLGNPRAIEMESGQFLFKDIQHPKMKVPKGLSIIATLQANKLDVAASLARGHTNRVLSLLSFLTTTSLPELRIIKVYDVTPGKKKGKFIQNSYDTPLETRSARFVDSNDLRIGVTSINKLDENDNNRVYRAMHWYRLALQSRDVLERFTSFWIGLETVNPILREYYGLDVEHRTCECGRKLHQTLNGFKHLLHEVTGDTKKWKQVRNLRAGTIHGFRDLKDITSELRNKVPLLEKTLKHGLNLILGLSERKVEDPLDLGNPITAYYTSSAMVEGPDLQLLDREVVPSIDIEVEVYEPEPGGQSHRFKPRPHIIDKSFSFKDVEVSLNVTPQVASVVEFTPMSED